MFRTLLPRCLFLVCLFVCLFVCVFLLVCTLWPQLGPESGQIMDCKPALYCCIHVLLSCSIIRGLKTYDLYIWMQDNTY